jgi:hypothetical protein
LDRDHAQHGVESPVFGPARDELAPDLPRAVEIAAPVEVVGFGQPFLEG